MNPPSTPPFADDLFRLALEAGRMGTWEWNIQTGALVWSDNLEAIHGMTPGSFDGTFRSFAQAIHSDDRARVLEAITTALEQKSDFSIEFRVIAQDGQIRWVGGEGRVFLNDAGQAIRMIGVGMDITARKETEQRLARSEARYRRLTDSIQQIVWTCRPDGSCDYFNEYLEQYTGIPVEQCLEWGWGSILHPDDLQRTISRWRRSVETGEPYEIEFRIRDAAGKYRWHLTRGLPLRDENGQILQWLGTSTDIDARRSAEEHRWHLAAIVDSADDAIVSKNLDGIVTSWNAAAERIYGYSAEEIIGKSKAIVIPPDLPNELSSILDKIRGGESIHHYDTVRLRKDGTRIQVSISVSPIRDATGTTIGASTIARDITERKQTEERFRQHQQEVESLNTRLRRSMVETHHRVKNNLQIISAMVDMQLLEGTPTLPTEEVKRLLSHVRTLAVVHDLLTEEAKEDGKADTVSAQAVLNKLLPLLQMTARGRQLQISLDDTHLTSRQATSLALITNEIVSNALKYSSDDVTVRFQVGDQEALLMVTDQGPGFPPGFNPKTLTTTGITLVENLSQWDLNGVASFENRPEGGAVVSIRMPLVPGSPARK